MCGSDAPTPPDPTATAQAQLGFSKEAAQAQAALNAVDQFGPLGSTTFTRDANGDPTSQTVNLSPDVQNWLNQQFGLSNGLNTQAAGLVGQLPQTPFDPSSLPSTDQIAKTAYDREVGLMQPQLDQQRNQMQVDLANRGLPIGNEARNTAEGNFQRTQDQALTGAAEDANLAANQQYQTNLGNALTERELPYQELSQALGSAPSFSTPNFQVNTPNSVAAPNYAAIVDNNYNQAVSQANVQNQGLFSGISAIGAAGVGLLSDENMKTNRKSSDGENILEHLRSMPIDDYDYKEGAQKRFGVPESRTGPMAQDYQKAFPEGSDGHVIDMPDMIGKLMAAVKALDHRTAKAA